MRKLTVPQKEEVASFSSLSSAQRRPLREETHGVPESKKGCQIDNGDQAVDENIVESKKVVEVVQPGVAARLQTGGGTFQGVEQDSTFLGLLSPLPPSSWLSKKGEALVGQVAKNHIADVDADIHEGGVVIERKVKKSLEVWVG